MEPDEVPYATDPAETAAVMQEQMEETMEEAAVEFYRFKLEIAAKFSTKEALVFFRQLDEEPNDIKELLDQKLDSIHERLQAARKARYKSIVNENYENEELAIRDLSALADIRRIWLDLLGMIEECFKHDDDMLLSESLEMLEQVL